jgi:glycine/D-amino acid oxidase-like deaminating enzyme
MTTIILGSGIIGLSTAYYLSLSLSQDPRNPLTQIHLIDSSPTLFASASGCAGGFLARNWFSPPVASLGALSFELHRKLALEHGGEGRWGYAPTRVYGLSASERTGGSKREVESNGDGEAWITDGTSRARVAPATISAVNPDGSPAVWTPQPGGTLDPMSSPDDCAQIEPRELCEFLLGECRARGVQLHLGTQATGIATDEAGAFAGVKVVSTDGRERGIECKNLIVAAGAWTPGVFKTLFPNSQLRVPIEPLAGYSLVVHSPRYMAPLIGETHTGSVVGDSDHGRKLMCSAIYCDPGRHWTYAPEAFARLARNGQTEVWVGGLNDPALALPELATDVKDIADAEKVSDLRRTTVQLVGLAGDGEDINKDDLETIREGLCFRPVSQRGTPLVGKVPDKYLPMNTGEGGGVYIASGHGPWGVSLSLGTGKVASEMILGRKTSADVKALRVGP